jgi:AIPR protein
MGKSTQELEELLSDIRQEVLLKSGDAAPHDYLETSFTEWSLELLSDHNEVSGWDLFYYKAEGRRAAPASKINAWALSGDGQTLDLFVTHYDGGGDVTNLGQTELRKQFNLLTGFLQRVRSGFYDQSDTSEAVYEVAKRIKDADETLSAVRFFLLTDCLVPNTAAIEEQPIPGLEVRYVLWDLKKLSQLNVNEKGSIEIDFKEESGESVPCLVGGSAKHYKTYLAFLPGHILAKIYRKYGQRLLERNVRTYLGASSGKVNKGLQETLRDEPERFLAYNNGLCCTASELRLEKRNDGQNGILWVKDLQIVNGGQTTASIAHAYTGGGDAKRGHDVSRVVVQVKLTVLNNQEDLNEIVPLIAKYANSQNKVNAADLAANGPFHIAVENLSRETAAPAIAGLQSLSYWFYERARGSYKDERSKQPVGKARKDWEKLYPIKHKFTKTDLAKYETAWNGLPHIVCLGAEMCFVKFAEKMDLEVETNVTKDVFKQIVAKAILWKTAESLFDTLDLDGYRSQSVAYAISWLAEKSGRRIDLDRIWKDQRVSQTMCETLKVVCRIAWEHIYGQAGNQQTAAKKLSCWESFRNKDVALPRNWEEDLADTPFVTASSEEELVEAAWNRVRGDFQDDPRTIEGLFNYTGIMWEKKQQKKSVATLCFMSWSELRDYCRKEKIKFPKIRTLIEILEIAAQDR